MKDVKISINSQEFPSQFVSDAEKATEEYGLKIGQAIQYEWFRKDSNRCRFYNQWGEYNRLRLYARGEQSIAKYKNELAVDGDLSYLNLDWTPVPILPKFVDIVVNGMADRLFKVNAYAQDALSQSKRSKYQSMIEGQMAARPMLEDIKKMGFDPFTVEPDQLPESDEELALFMQMNYKPAIELAQEEAIDTLFENNKYVDLRKRFDYDLTVLGVAMAKHEFLPGSGVKISYVDPANVVYSYTEDPHFKDCFYWGEIKTLPITELMKIDPTLTNEDLEEISKYSQSWYDYFNTAQYYQNSLFYRDTCTLLYFNYKTTNKIVYKKKITDDAGNSRMIEKDDQFNPPEEMMKEGKFEKIEKTIDVWYEGVMVMGTNIILKWKMAENMVRPKSANQYAIPNYVAVAPRMYKGVIESLVRRMIPFADLIQITHLKLQQVISRVVPDGVFIDADGLNEVDLGTGNAYNPEDALRLYFQTGSVIGRSYTQDGDFNQARVPITQLNSNSGASKTQMLIGNYNHYLNMIRSVTGLNEARDGTTPDPNALVGVQKLAALNSNTATRHILDGSLFIYRSLAEALSYRVADIIEYSDFKDNFINQIGKYNVSILEDSKELYIYDFGIFIEVAPDEEEKAKLEQNIQMALNKQDINLEDAIDIREIRNLKLANQLLKLKRKQKQKADMQMKSAQAQQQAQINQQSQQMAAQTAMQKIQAEGQIKMQIKQSEIAFEIEKMKQEAQLKSMLMDKEFQFNQQLRGMSEAALSQRELQREDAKSQRINQQNTQQSQLINQRKNNLPPKNFESNEDSLDGFDLAEFDPR
tara:strand:+ start:13370 stop:15805 length:2436 start_codon:yes stop_codon:yes gene_type:complete